MTTPRLTLDSPDDPDDRRVDAAVHEYLTAAEAGPFDAAAWLARQPAELRPPLARFVAEQQTLARFRPPPPRTVPLALPDFHRYSRLRLVGKGGMGAVYKANDAVLERAVAVKVIHPDLAARPADAERFLREARVVARLQHRNVIPIYDYGLMPGTPPRPYFTMQLVLGDGEDPRGTTLKDAIRQYHAARTAGRFQTLLTAFVGVCDAVAHAHAADVLHRDLKPGNVLARGDRDVLVVDWGLSKVLTPHTRHTTGLGGTTEYLSPEAAGGAEVGKPADVFGLGGILAELLTGNPVYRPAEGSSAAEQAARADTSGCVERMRASGHPPELVQLAERCLAVNPAERPTAVEMAAAVAGYLASVEERAKKAEIEAAKAAERETHTRRRQWLPWLLAAVATAVAAAAVVYAAVRSP